MSQQPQSNSSFLVVDSQNLMATFKPLPMLPIPQHQWDSIRTKVGSIEGEAWILPGIATAFLGGAIASVFALFSTTLTPNQTHDVWWFLAFCLVATAGFGTAALMQRKRNSSTAAEIISVMSSCEATLNMPNGS